MSSVFLGKAAGAATITLVLLVAAACSPGDDNGEGGGEESSPVTIEQVGVEPVEETERSMARSEAFSSPQVAAEVAGRIELIERDIGDTVEAGDVLARLERDSYRFALSAANAEAAALQARLGQYERELRRLEGIGPGQNVSESDLEAAEADVSATRSELEAAENHRDEASREYERTEIRAPMDGQVDQRMISEGDYISSGEAAFRLVPDASARVLLPYPERVADELSPGLSARLRRMGGDDADWIDGEVTRIRPSVDDGMGVVVVVEFEPPEIWPSGTLLEGEVVTDRREEALVVPSDSVVDRPGRHVVFVLPGDDSEGEVEEREVDRGYRTPEFTEILDGVEADERVVVDGAEFLGSGSRVRVTGESEEDDEPEDENVRDPDAGSEDDDTAESGDET